MDATANNNVAGNLNPMSSIGDPGEGNLVGAKSYEASLATPPATGSQPDPEVFVPAEGGIPDSFQVESSAEAIEIPVSAGDGRRRGCAGQFHAEVNNGVSDG